MAGVVGMQQGSIWRAAALVALALVMPALAGVMAGPVLAADRLRVGKAQAQPFTFAPLDIGIEQGIFAKHNLDIEATAFPGSANLQRGIASDSIDIAVGSG